MIDQETGYDFQGFSELHLDLADNDAKAIAFLRKLNGKSVEKANILQSQYNMYSHKRKERNMYYQCPQIQEFCRFISATSDFSESCKQIYVHNKRTNNFKMVVYYNQNQEATGTDKKGFEYIQTTKFFNYLDYYITKNSFVQDLRNSKCIRSFDNIVIDIDNHSNSLTIDQINDEITKLIDCLYRVLGVEFNVVRTGRGVHIWVHLKSFYGGSNVMQKIYVTLCNKICDDVERVIQDNHINLDVDRGASTDMVRVVRLPYTYNTKVHKRTTFYRYTNKHYTLDELCEKYNIHKSTGKSKKSKSAKLQYNTTGIDFKLYLKRKNYIEWLVNEYQGNCKGRRNNIIFLYYNYCIQIHSISDAQALTMQLNNRFCEPLPQSHLNAIFRHADKMVYRYSNNKFLMLLDANTSDIAKYNTPSREIARQQAREKKEKRNQAIQELSRQGYTANEIAEIVGCSRSTVFRHKNQVDNQEQEVEVVEVQEQEQETTVTEINSVSPALKFPFIDKKENLKVFSFNNEQVPKIKFRN